MPKAAARVIPLFGSQTPFPKQFYPRTAAVPNSIVIRYRVELDLQT
jgi:hypothetical protein